jgi:hypothetical protein
VSEGFWALPNHRGSGSLTSDWIFMVTVGDIPVTPRENFDALTSESQKAKHVYVNLGLINPERRFFFKWGLPFQ